MLIIFDDPHLELLAIDQEAGTRLPANVVASFRRLLTQLIEADDERTLRARKSLHFEKLMGNRSHQYSMRLNKQFRLIVEIESRQPKNVLHLVSIEDYH